MAENVPSLGRDLDIQYHEDNRSLPNNLLQNTLYYNCLKPKTKREFLKQQEKKRKFYTYKKLFPSRQIHKRQKEVKYVVVQSPSFVQLFMTPWTAGCQASLSLSISRSLPKFMSIESVMPSNHLILCHLFFCLQSFPASGSFPMSQLFASGGQSIGASAWSQIYHCGKLSIHKERQQKN